MNDSFDYMMDILFGLIVALVTITFTVTVFAMGTRHNAGLTEEIGKKASSRYTMENYGNIHVYVSKSDIFSDIMAGDPAIAIQINGIALNADVIEKARNNEAVAVRAVMNALTHTQYRKVPTYDSNGVIRSINYIGG